MRNGLWLVMLSSVFMGCAAPTPTESPDASDASTADAKSPAQIETRSWYPYCMTYNGNRGCFRIDATASKVGSSVTVHLEAQSLEGTLVPTNAVPVAWLQLNGIALEHGGPFDPASLRLLKMGTVGKVARADKPKTLYGLWIAQWQGGTAWNVQLAAGASRLPEPGAITGCSEPMLGFATCPNASDGRVFWDVEFTSTDWTLNRTVLGASANMRLASGAYVGIGCTGELPGTCAVEPEP